MGAKFVPVKDVMHTRFLELDGLATVKDAVQAMRKSDAEVVVVEKRHENDALGVVLLADIALQIYAKDRAPERVNVYEIMIKPVVTVEPDLGVRYCVRLMDRCNLNFVPVVDAGQVVGIIGYPELVFKGFSKV